LGGGLDFKALSLYFLLLIGGYPLRLSISNCNQTQEVEV